MQGSKASKNWELWEELLTTSRYVSIIYIFGGALVRLGQSSKFQGFFVGIFGDTESKLRWMWFCFPLTGRVGGVPPDKLQKPFINLNQATHHRGGRLLCLCWHLPHGACVNISQDDKYACLFVKSFNKNDRFALSFEIRLLSSFTSHDGNIPNLQDHEMLSHLPLFDVDKINIIHESSQNSSFLNLCLISICWNREWWIFSRFPHPFNRLPKKNSVLRAIFPTAKGSHQSGVDFDVSETSL